MRYVRSSVFYAVFLIPFSFLLICSCTNKPASSASTLSISIQGSVSNGGAVSGASVTAYSIIGTASGTGVQRSQTLTPSSIDTDSTLVVGTATSDSNGEFTLSLNPAYETVPLMVKATGGMVASTASTVTLEAALPSTVRAPIFQLNSLTTVAAGTLKALPAFAAALTSAPTTATVGTLVEEVNGQLANVFTLSGDIFYPGNSTSYALAQAALNLLPVGTITAIETELAGGSGITTPTLGLISGAVSQAQLANPSTLGMASVTLVANPPALGASSPVCTMNLVKANGVATFSMVVSAAGAATIAYSIANAATPTTVYQSGTISGGNNGEGILQLSLPYGQTWIVTANGVSGNQNGPKNTTTITITPP